MSYFPGVFITQYHKSRSGYFINHDLLINCTPSIIQLLPKLAINSSSTLLQNTLLKKLPLEIIFSIFVKGIADNKQKREIWIIHYVVDLCNFLRNLATYHCYCTQKTQNHCNQRYCYLDCPSRLLRYSCKFNSLENPIGKNA